VEALAKSLNEMLSELELNVEKTEQALISSRAFASNVAHELRTPLTSMRMNLDLLGRHPNVDSEEKSKILGNIISGQDRLLSTLESLRLLSRGDLSEGDVFEEIDFVQLIRDIVSRHQNQWPDVNIHVYLPPTPPLVFGWLEGLAVLFRNVIENSCVHAGIPNQDLVIDFSVEARGEELHVNMDDNGVGIPESERDQVLERFNRGSNSMGTGSGLGLSLVKQQVELHGGSVKLSDSPSGGTRVSIVLPIILLRCQGYCQ
jgi:two-component system sensor histidine kinase PrrB